MSGSNNRCTSWFTTSGWNWIYRAGYASQSFVAPAGVGWTAFQIVNRQRFLRLGSVSRLNDWPWSLEIVDLGVCALLYDLGDFCRLFLEYAEWDVSYFCLPSVFFAWHVRCDAGNTRYALCLDFRRVLFLGIFILWRKKLIEIFSYWIWDII